MSILIVVNGHTTRSGTKPADGSIFPQRLVADTLRGLVRPEIPTKGLGWDRGFEDNSVTEAWLWLLPSIWFCAGRRPGSATHQPHLSALPGRHVGPSVITKESAAEGGPQFGGLVSLPCWAPSGRELCSHRPSTSKLTGLCYMTGTLKYAKTALIQ